MTDFGATARARGVALGGFMASGKTTVGGLVAEAIGLPFVDLDVEVAAQAGAAIEEVFRSEGEAGFRAREELVLRRIVVGPTCVLALGGGTLHSAPSRALLDGAFDIVVLDAPWAVVARRLARAGAGRPLAASAASLYRERRPGYLSAGVVIPVEGRTAVEVARAVVAAVRPGGTVAPG